MVYPHAVPSDPPFFSDERAQARQLNRSEGRPGTAALAAGSLGIALVFLLPAGIYAVAGFNVWRSHPDASPLFPWSLAATCLIIAAVLLTLLWRKR